MKSISSSDEERFKSHVAVLELFGKKLGAHMRAMYMLDDEFCVWFPKMFKNNDFANFLSTDGKIFEMKQFRMSSLANDKVFPQDEPGKRIIFAQIEDADTGQKYYKFLGVFTELNGDIRYASCRRLSDTLYFDGAGHYSASQ